MATRQKAKELDETANRDVFDKWFDLVSDWADTHAKHVTFARDEYDGWFATIHFSDASGAYSATIDQIRKRQKESGPAYHDRVNEQMRAAVEDAYRKRTLRLARRPMAIADVASW